MIRVRNFWVHSGSASKRTSFTKPFLLEDVSFIIQLRFKITSTHGSIFSDDDLKMSRKFENLKAP